MNPAVAPAVSQVFDNPYLCWELCRWHPMVYARLMLVSRRFKDWIDSEEEVLVYDPAARDFRKKTVNRDMLKQNYMESWVVTVHKTLDSIVMGYETLFAHSKKEQSVQDRPSRVIFGYLKAWSKNGQLYRKKGPHTIINYVDNRVVKNVHFARRGPEEQWVASHAELVDAQTGRCMALVKTDLNAAIQFDDEE